jgi:threonyl-tRNA synthetase
MRVLPISDKFLDYAKQVEHALVKQGFRVTIDRSSDRVNNKIRVAQETKIPYMLVVGGKDEANQTVSVRDRSAGDLGAMPLDDFIDKAHGEIDAGTQPVEAPASSG